MWAYPWDIVDKGATNVIEELSDLGIDKLYVAANYHTVESFSPHNPERKTYFTDAGAHFRPEKEYGDLSPAVNPDMQRYDQDWLEQISEAVKDSPIQLNTWVVGCHSTTLGMKHDDLSITSPFGDSLVFGLCPSQPAVQEYLKTMLSDIDRYDVDEMLLETFHYFHGSGWGWHHDKFHADIGELGEYLLGLCFCEECMETAADADVDVDSARKQSKKTIIQLAEGRIDSNISPADFIEEHKEIKAYSEARKETLNSLHKKLISTTDADLGSFIGMKGVDNSWMHGLDLETLQHTMDYFTLMDYTPDVDKAVDTYQMTTNQIDSAPIRPGILPGHPIVNTEEEVKNQVHALHDAGAEEITIYNYGLLPEKNLSWIGQAIESVKQ